MNDHELDALVASAASVRDDQVDSLPLSPVEADLCEAIMATTLSTSDQATEEASPVGDPATRVVGDLTGHRRRPTRRRLLVFAAAAALIIGAVFVFGSGGSDDGSAYAASAVEVAEAAPRLRVDADGWRITDVQAFEPSEGEVTFADGSSQVELFWRPGDTHDQYVADRASDGEALGTVEVAGHRAQLFDTGGYNLMWRQGGVSVELMIGIVQDTRADLDRLVAQIDEVSVDDWLAAMPDSVVKPTEQAAAVEQALADIPVPKGFDQDALSAEDIGAGRYQFGARVTGSVACAWMRQWLTATDDGDQAAAAEAVQAMATSRDWSILLEIGSEGEWPEAIWGYADTMAAGGPRARIEYALTDCR